MGYAEKHCHVCHSGNCRDGRWLDKNGLAVLPVADLVKAFRAWVQHDLECGACPNYILGVLQEVCELSNEALEALGFADLQ